MQRQFHGIPVSPGIAIASAFVRGSLHRDAPEYEVADPELEIIRFQEARDHTREDLKKLLKRTEDELGAQHAGIFNAHLLLLDDVQIVEEVETRIRTYGRNAEWVVMEVTAQNAALLADMPDPAMRERREDLLDVADRIVRDLLNDSRPDLDALDEPSIILADTLPPSDTASLDLAMVRGIALETGGTTSHTAILARALGIPAVMGLGDILAHVTRRTPVIIDGGRGLLILDPTPECIATYQQAITAYEEHRSSLEKAALSGPFVLPDGTALELLANIALPLEITAKLRHVASGIGLYRTEFLFLNRGALPNEDEQYEAYRQAAEALHPHPVTIRTMDIGGDKFVSSLSHAREDNPQLGWRALRFCLDRRDLFEIQLRAVLRASTMGNVRLMFPMVAGLEDLRAARRILREVSADLDQRGIAYDHRMPVGIMIEVPSAVVTAPMLAAECDFFSIGTNDLIQYTLAVDRGNEFVSQLYQPAHPAVLRMLRMTLEAARQAAIPCSVCGEMAGEARYALLLAALGIRSLSMSPFALPIVRAALNNCSAEVLAGLAQSAFACGTAAEIEHLLESRLPLPQLPDADSACGDTVC